MCCTLKGRTHLERKKEEDICMRNHSDPSLSVPVINMLQNGRYLINFVVDSKLTGSPVAVVHSQRPVHSSHHVCQDTALLSPCKMWIRWQKMPSRVNSLTAAANLLACSSRKVVRHLFFYF